MSGDNPDITRPAPDNIDAGAAASRLTMEKAIAAAALLTDNRWQQYLLVLLAVRSFYSERNAVRLPVYIVVDRQTDIAAVRRFLLRYFNAARISSNVIGQALNAPRSECAVVDLIPGNFGTFYWLRECAYRRSMPLAIGASEHDAEDECRTGDSVFIIPRDFAAAASAWGIIIDIGG